MKIDSLVVQIIKALNFNHFTTSDVRSAYIALSKDPVLDPIIIRRKLYSELLKLVNNGWLKKKLLTAKLNNYKAELLLNLGEAEAYKELYDEFPELVTDI